MRRKTVQVLVGKFVSVRIQQVNDLTYPLVLVSCHSSTLYNRHYWKIRKLLVCSNITEYLKKKKELWVHRPTEKTKVMEKKEKSKYGYKSCLEQTRSRLFFGVEYAIR